MKHIKEILEKQLGKISDREFVFAITQFERNSRQVGQADRKMSRGEALDELSTNIDFYRRHL